VTDLILGTAQFGSGYGVTNSAGRLDDEAVADILTVAANGRIELFDTAPDYGDAQARIRALRPTDAVSRYVSKFGLPTSANSVIDAASLYEASMSALGVDSLYGLLFHRVDDIRDDRAHEAWQIMLRARDEGRITHIGASIYDTDDLAAVLDRFPELDLIQVPGNLVDRRLLDHPDMTALHERGVEIHVRSVYLQGLLLSSPEDIPEDLGVLRPVVAQLSDIARHSNRSVLELALGYLKRHPVVDAVLVGAASPTELAATLAAWNGSKSGVDEIPDPRLPPAVLDPRQWSRRVSK
jgi:aryl-alcohol dehydrogenase-like predicted oxidoreductase